VEPGRRACGGARLTCSVSAAEFATLSAAVAALMRQAAEDKTVLEPRRAEMCSRHIQAKRDHESKQTELEALPTASSLVGQAADARRLRSST